jgi:2,4-dienoyl-CoA reductase-like NADH-dependent reductase (Old Yellow Enzyme family)
MSTSESTLFSPFALKNFTLKNRIGVAPMTRMSADNRCIPRQDVLDFLVRRAENGAGLVYTEAIVTDYESAQGYPGQSRITTKPQIDAWRQVVHAIHRSGSLAIMQIFHCGRMGWPEVNPAHRVIAPSPIPPRQNNPLTGHPYPSPEEMSHFDIDHVIHGFAETASGAIAAGFDGVEIHGAHGYLISQFLSAYSNRRKDGYGGSTENRYRFAHEVIEAIQPVIPADKLLIFRISNWGIADPEISLFEDAAEWQNIIKMLSDEPIDALSISTYDFQMKAFTTDKTMSELTRQVTRLPLMICGKIYDLQTASLALEHADIALMGKSMLLNPNIVSDLKMGKTLPNYTSEEANIAYTDTPLP